MNSVRQVGQRSEQSVDAAQTIRSRMDLWFDRAALVYVNLWILEGAFRKWVPGSENAMYFLRDILLVLALAALAMSGRVGRSRSPRFVLFFWSTAAMLSVFAVLQVLAELITLPVAIVGLRSYIAPLLLPL